MVPQEEAGAVGKTELGNKRGKAANNTGPLGAASWGPFDSPFLYIITPTRLYFFHWFSVVYWD